MRRGQVTIFFMIGIVLLILVLFIVEVVSLKPAERPTAITSNNYLSSCVVQAFYDQLDKLADDEDIMKGIEEGTGYLGWSETDYYDDNFPTTFLTPYFGLLVLPPLCDPDGLNAPSNGEYPVCIGSYGENSIQTNLRTNLQTAVEDCLATTEGLDIELLNPEVELILFQNTVRIIVNTTQSNFEKDYNIPLYEMYFFIREQLINNLKNPEVNIVSDPAENSHYIPGFTITRTSSDSTYIYSIMALNHDYRGTIFTWNIEVDNRLEYNDCDNDGTHNIDPDEAINNGCSS